MFVPYVRKDFEDSSGQVPGLAGTWLTLGIF
jgi:hypothetical protein